ncbi:hypothetical protein A2U01_0077913, partial [Trifolium medium]|nr:hypothetical protein [Trifolium medium]
MEAVKMLMESVEHCKLKKRLRQKKKIRQAEQEKKEQEEKQKMLTENVTS